MKKLFLVALSIAMASLLFTGCNKETAKISTVEDLQGKKIGVQKGTTSESWVSENITDNEKLLLSYNSGIDAALELKNGAIDAVIIDELPAKAIVEKNPDLEILDIKLTEESYSIAVKKGNTELLNSINETMERLKSSGEYETLVNAFMPADGNIIVPQDMELLGEKVLRVGTNVPFTPFEFLQGDKIVGFDISMSQNIAKDFDAKLEVVNMDFNALITALDAEAVNFVAAGLSVTEEHKKYVDFSQPYYTSSQVIIVKK